jgi:hypothetical protein
MAQMKITDGKGVHFTFDNGLTISIQIGRGNYGDNYDWPHYEVTRENPLPPSSKAEIAVWSTDGAMVDIECDCVKGYVPIEEVLRLTEFLRSLPSDLEKDEVELAFRGFDWGAERAA